MAKPKDDNDDGRDIFEKALGDDGASVAKIIASGVIGAAAPLIARRVGRRWLARSKHGGENAAKDSDDFLYPLSRAVAPVSAGWMAGAQADIESRKPRRNSRKKR